MAKAALGAGALGAAACVAAVLALTGCTTTGGAIQGKIDAGVTLPAWPAECRMKEIHAALVKGEDVRVILQRERKALERANQRNEECAAYYDRLRNLFGGVK